MGSENPRIRLVTLISASISLHLLDLPGLPADHVCYYGRKLARHGDVLHLLELASLLLTRTTILLGLSGLDTTLGSPAAAWIWSASSPYDFIYDVGIKTFYFLSSDNT